MEEVRRLDPAFRNRQEWLHHVDILRRAVAALSEAVTFEPGGNREMRMALDQAHACLQRVEQELSVTYSRHRPST